MSSSIGVARRVLVMKFASEFILIYPLYTIMFGERGGVNAAGVGTILALGYVFSVLFEIPTGIVADKVPRKYVLIASIICKILALSTWLYLPHFRGFLLAALLFALSNALESGALQAYLYGTLGTENKSRFNRVWARVSAMVMISYTSAYIASYFVGVHYTVLIGWSIVSCAAALLLCVSLPLDEKTKPFTAARPKVFKSALQTIRLSADLKKLLISGVIAVAVAEVCVEYAALYYHQVGVATKEVALVLAFGNILGALSFWKLHHYEVFFNKHKLKLLLFTLALFAASFAGGTIVACAGLLLFLRFVRLLQVQYEANVQHLASEDARATIASIGAFISKLLTAAMIALVGVFATENNVVQPLRLAFLAAGAMYCMVQLYDARRETA